MTNQIILNNNIILPQSNGDKFSCWEEYLSVTVEMISGRQVIERRSGKIWKASYSFDYMGNDLLRQVLTVLRSGAPFPALVMPDNQDTFVSSMFLLESITQPTWAFEKNGKGLWHNLAFTIREEEPHD